MTNIVNTYSFSESVALRGVTGMANNTSFFVIGTIGKKGFYGVIGNDGHLQWGRTVSINEREVVLINALPLPNGDFLVYGSYAIPPKNHKHVLFRTKPNGQLVWQKETSTEKSRYPIRLLENVNVQADNTAFPYTLVGWYNKSSSIDTFEFKHLSENGWFLNLSQSTGDKSGIDCQIITGCSLGVEASRISPQLQDAVTGLALGGGTKALGGYTPYLVLGRERFQNRTNYALPFKRGSKSGEIEAMYYDVVTKGLVLGINHWSTAGQNKDGNSLIIGFLPINPSNPLGLDKPFTGLEFRITEKGEHVRKIIRLGGFFYAILNSNEGNYGAVIRFRIDQAGQVSLTDCKKYALGANTVLFDLVPNSHDGLVLIGRGTPEGQSVAQGYFMLTDMDMNNCIAQPLPLPVAEKIELAVRQLEPERLPTEKNVNWKENAIDLVLEDANPKPTLICPAHEFELETVHAIQSPYLNLQAAGSLGSDSSAGIHLRWFLLNYLGDNHLPKGNYATNTFNFNRPDDFVCIYRWRYERNPIRLELKNQPLFIDEYRKIWTYKVGQRIFYLHFHDANKYNSVRSGNNPYNDAYNFIANYHPAPLELKLRDELFFAGNLQMSGAPAFTLFLETHSVAENTVVSPIVVSSSSEYSEAGGSTARFMEENIRSLYFSLQGGNIETIEIETYADAIFMAARKKEMDLVGRFALTKDTAEAYLRLEDTSRFQVHGTWRKFNDGAFVNVANYRQRWFDSSKPDESILHGITSYIQLSDVQTNPKAIDTLYADAPDTDTPPIDASYLDMLQMVSADFQIARMLGLGHIDTPPLTHAPVSSKDKNVQPAVYLYMAVYVTEGDLNNGSGPGRLQHLYLSLPTSRQNERLPLPLEINKLTYGLYAQHNSPTPILLTDANGYTPDGQSRFINIFTQLPYDYLKYPGRLPSSKRFFSFASFTYPVFAGIEYKKQGEGNWRSPEIAHEETYIDTYGQPETIPLVIQDDKPTLIHRETEEGIHEYGPYSVNIFSRAWQLGSTVATDFTKFIKRNTLLPPSDFHVQLIQRENPLLLTTIFEQNLLSQIGTSDKTLVRIIFNYHHVHDRAYDFADRVRIYFRPDPPRAVFGEVDLVQDVGALEQDIHATDFFYASTGETKVPDIPTALRSNFLGSSMAVAGKQFIVHDIAYNGGNSSRPILRIKKNEERYAQINGSQASLSQLFIGLNATNDVAKPFMLVENMSQAANWGAQNPLSFEVQIGDTSQWATRTDQHVNGNGDTTSYELRGIWANALIVVISGTNGGEGAYHLRFPGFQLNNHPQHNASNPVEWFNGIVRIGYQGDATREKKVLKVTAIYHIGDGQDLELDVYDDAYNSSEFDLNNPVEVNFYPGYKAYFYYETAIGFTENTILPAAGEGFRNTLMGACSVDSGNSYQSNVGIPAILMAQEIVEPLQPQLPQGPLYATLPDWYNKATYTFSVQLQHTPYAVIFYRADLNAILYALYKPETVQSIRETLPLASEDELFTSRWQDLLTFPSGAFADFPTGAGAYRFPKPDKVGSFDGATEPGASTQMREKVMSAFYSAFLPLTKEPLLHKSIQGNSAITPANPAKITGNTVQFTDFTIDGSMVTSYFYCAREMGNRMDFSKHSSISGPVQLVNTSPPPSPVVQKMTVRLNDQYSGTTSALMFKINDFPSYDTITKIQVYRAMDVGDALSVRTMKMVKEIAVSGLTAVDNILAIEDDFLDLTEIPYGTPMYYRIGSVREIHCKDVWGNDIVKYVPSYPTKVFLANVVDTINPEPPVLKATFASATANELIGVRLDWSKTTYSGIYRLFKMTSSGNWAKVFEIKANDPNELTYAFADPLPILDEEGNPIYHHFKVGVESTSGLLNLYDKMKTVPGA